MHNYFTITAGRTGSAWLASFLSQNLNINEVHEFLGINDFGNKMPDIRTMRNFNNFGNNEFVQNMLLKSLKISIFLLYLSGMNVKFFEHQLKLLITSVIEPKFKSKPAKHSIYETKITD